MAKIDKKAMQDSKVYKSRQVFPQDTNHLGTLFGGTMMANIDEIAAICAMKHANQTVVTASTDSVDFLKPIRNGDILTYIAMVSYSGSSSMEVCVQILIEDIPNNKQELAALSFLTFVALDDDGKPTKVTAVYPETEAEKWFHETAEARVARRKARRQESKQTLQFISELEFKQ
ncbi:acyl-CoA thioesterase [Staphylococcus pseudintermedius]|uniref:acyl-CoA thioesterase n=1 Tax=Staphylococcus pseudintermedius TaxID=283734 RepID=UPI000BBCC309|nr:acyl-CoA thioesterase [Staphylococcus pseudintermedius]EGQ1659437.1 acyl-CoA thioesterase [Staphylococcus pseudintermedius]EGQ1672029.1 acyl-CoA thioesterase [Staphylococcus pseudintermedius]EGQ1714152.1 acyl-CoA thioesterase [Staphylococcus pseudintermedius]EGQ2808544.1 acyl-CoA thioesterase [Staphylococcus pseudintermedius]EGQ2859342.1 acyl-CoA thioesterase [Staphylococcus pseudintermedius]